MLVPIDFSECTNGQIKQASAYADRLGLSLTLLHVIRDPALREESDQLLAEYASQVPAGAKTLTRMGEPHEVITQVAEELGVEMIVVGTHGRRGLSRVVLGSVAEEVLRAAKVPVLALRSQHSPQCTARGCAWCESHVTRMEQKLRDEEMG